MQLHFSFLKIFASIIVQVQCASISLKIMIWLGDGTMSKPFNQVFGVQLSPAQGEALLFQAAGNDKSPRIPPIRADPRITAQNYRWPINFLTKHLPQIKVRLFVRSVLLPFPASAGHPGTHYGLLNCLILSCLGSYYVRLHMIWMQIISALTPINTS